MPMRHRCNAFAFSFGALFSATRQTLLSVKMYQNVQVSGTRLKTNRTSQHCEEQLDYSSFRYRCRCPREDGEQCGVWDFACDLHGGNLLTEHCSWAQLGSIRSQCVPFAAARWSHCIAWQTLSCRSNFYLVGPLLNELPTDCSTTKIPTSQLFAVAASTAYDLQSTIHRTTLRPAELGLLSRS